MKNETHIWTPRPQTTPAALGPGKNQMNTRATFETSNYSRRAWDRYVQHQIVNALELSTTDSISECAVHPCRVGVIRWPGQKRRAVGHKRQHVIKRRLRVLPTCPEWLRLSHRARGTAATMLETSWWIGNKNYQNLRRTHRKLCFM